MDAALAPASAQVKASPGRKKTLQPWERQPQDNDLWWHRFLIYLALGPTRSVSKVAMSRPNAYPIPAHWPIQAKQLNWRERAVAFDEAAKLDQKLISGLNRLLTALAPLIAEAARAEVRSWAEGVVLAGYQKPIVEEEEPLVLPVQPLGTEYRNGNGTPL